MYRRLTTEQMDEPINEVATEEERRNGRDITKICSNRIDIDPSLYYALGVVLIMEGIFSGIVTEKYACRLSYFYVRFCQILQSCFKMKAIYNHVSNVKWIFTSLTRNFFALSLRNDFK